MKEIMEELNIRHGAYSNLIERVNIDNELRLILMSKQSELLNIISLLKD